MRVLPSLTALLLGAATALLFACGGNGRIPSSDASRVENALNEVSADFKAGNCAAAEQAVAKASSALNDLPDTVDSRLRRRLRSGIAELSQRVPATCGQAQPQDTQPTQPDTTSTPTDTQPTVPTDTTPTVPSDTTPTVPTDTNGTGTSGVTPPGTDTNGTDTGTGGAPPGG
jgi:hypothetical protein